MALGVKLLVLLALANAAPLLAKNILRERWCYPLDGRVLFFDGQPIFGASKTVRGVVAALLVTSLGALFLGLELNIGFSIAVYAMAGDLSSSFIKRRLGRASSSRATGLDQIPEALFPLLAVRSVLSLSWIDIALVVLGFFVGEIVLSKLLFKYHLRDRPY